MSDRIILDGVLSHGTTKGLRGYSAYEIAVQNGFVGTEEEWLASLIGNGIERVEFNSDYTLTIYCTDGTSYTTSNIRGETGNGIASVVFNSDFTLTINFTDGNSYTTGNIRGATPDLHIAGVETLEPDQDAYVTINGSAEHPAMSFGIPKGDKGDKGDAGIDAFVDGEMMTIQEA